MQPKVLPRFCLGLVFAQARNGYNRGVPESKDWIRAGTPWKVRNPGMDKETMISRRGFFEGRGRYNLR